MTIEERKCRFPDEAGILKMHKTYSQTNCLFECSYNYASKKVLEKYNSPLKGVACSPWFFPSPVDTIQICTPNQTDDFLGFMSDILPKDECSHCVPDCNRTIYDPIVTAVPFKYAYQKIFVNIVFYKALIFFVAYQLH